MEPLRLFFDECCSIRLPKKIAEVFAEDIAVETKHLVEYFDKGDDDEDWLPILENHNSKWIVVTADRGRDPKKPKLPFICEELGVTHIMMTPTLKDAGYVAQKQALLTVWPQIVRTPFLPRGTRISLGVRRYTAGGHYWPSLQIGKKPFDVWCHKKGLGLPE